MEVPTWLLLSSISVAWLLWCFAGVWEVKVEDRRNPLPDGTRRGFSIVPVIPLYPVALWGIAKLIDRFANPWGSVSIVLLHAILGVVALGSCIRDHFRLRPFAHRPFRKSSGSTVRLPGSACP